MVKEISSITLFLISIYTYIVIRFESIFFFITIVIIPYNMIKNGKYLYFVDNKLISIPINFEQVWSVSNYVFSE